MQPTYLIADGDVERSADQNCGVVQASAEKQMVQPVEQMRPALQRLARILGNKRKDFTSFPISKKVALG